MNGLPSVFASCSLEMMIIPQAVWPKIQNVSDSSLAFKTTSVQALTVLKIAPQPGIGDE
tara:strand:- start:725 stop:901 length:177 start_codon:yes stop_codon:yes gene_type:complete